MIKFLLGNPYVLLGVGALILALAGWGFTEDRLRAAAEKSEAAAEKQSLLTAADADRWHKASDLRDTALSTMTEAYQRQNAKIEAARVDNGKLDAINARYEAQFRAQRDATETDAQEIKHEAQQHPDQVRHLGPVACGAYRRLYGAGAACTDTGTAPPN